MLVHVWGLLFDAVLGYLAPPTSTLHIGMDSCRKGSPRLRWKMIDDSNMLQLPLSLMVVEEAPDCRMRVVVMSCFSPD